MTEQRAPIFSEEDFIALDSAIQAIDDLEEDVVRAKTAEIDIGDVEARMAETRRRLVGIKRAFAPNRS